MLSKVSGAAKNTGIIRKHKASNFWGKDFAVQLNYRNFTVPTVQGVYQFLFFVVFVTERYYMSQVKSTKLTMMRTSVLEEFDSKMNIFFIKDNP